jgi:hypothetical protein
MNDILLAVTGLSLLVAGFMSAIAWRMSREERRRSDARIAALSSAIYEENGEQPGTFRLFDQGSAPSEARYGMVAVVGACVVSVIVALTVIGARLPRNSQQPPVRTSEASRSVPDAPLELLALENERDGDQLVVRGIVRNPLDAVERDGLTAVVLVFGHDGALISTGRAAVPAGRLGPGATTPFVVSIAGAANVDRFRLSFRTDTRIEPHVDRRTS